LTHVKQHKFFLSRQGDIIHSSYYIHRLWRDRKNFGWFICVNYGPNMLL